MNTFPKLVNFQGETCQNKQIFHLKVVAKTMKLSFFPELDQAFQYIETLDDLRCVLITSSNKNFSNGLDLMDAASSLQTEEGSDTGREGIKKLNLIKQWQNNFNKMQECKVPVICGIDNYCIGGAIDMICNADIRVCTQQSKFSVKEIDIGLCADLGTTQKLPLICSNDSLLREIMFTGRIFNHQEAKNIGLVSNCYKDKQEMLEQMMILAEQIASKSPVAIWTIKNVMNHQQLQNSQANLRYMQAINSCMLQTQDIKIAGLAGIQKQKAIYPKL